jgi:Putative beta barrel porin-7 (BBP7)
MTETTAGPIATAQTICRTIREEATVKRMWRSSLVWLVLVVSTLSARDPWVGPRPSPGDCTSIGFAVDWLYLRRENPERTAVAQEFLTGTDILTRELSTDDGNFDDESGVRFLAGIDLGGCIFEATFFRLSDWQSIGFLANQDPTQFDLQSPFLNVNGSTVPALSFIYDSDLTSAEASARAAFVGDGCVNASAMVGFRHLDIDENFRLAGAQAVPGLPLTSELTAVTTTNNLYGFQFGGDVTLTMGEILYFTFFGKGGVYLNDTGHRIRNSLSLLGAEPVQRLDLIQREHGIAASVEAGVTLNVRIAECALLRGGYHLLYVGGLALAPEQLQSNAIIFTNTILPNNTDVFSGIPSELNREGEVIFHGLMFGLEVSF